MIKGLDLNYLNNLEVQISILNHQFNKLSLEGKHTYIKRLTSKIGINAIKGIFDIKELCFNLGYNFLLYLNNLRLKQKHFINYSPLTILDILLCDVADYTSAN